MSVRAITTTSRTDVMHVVSSPLNVQQQREHFDAKLMVLSKQRFGKVKRSHFGPAIEVSRRVLFESLKCRLLF